MTKCCLLKRNTISLTSFFICPIAFAVDRQGFFRQNNNDDETNVKFAFIPRFYSVLQIIICSFVRLLLSKCKFTFLKYLDCQWCEMYLKP